MHRKPQNHCKFASISIRHREKKKSDYSVDNIFGANYEIDLESADTNQIHIDEPIVEVDRLK